MNASSAQVIIIEDDDNMRELLALNLRDEGYRVRDFFSVEQFEREDLHPDLLILDIMLPGMNGLDYAEKIHREGRRIPVLITSALHQQDKIQRGYGAGIIDYVTKPFDLELLLTKVKNLLQLFEPRKTDRLPSRIGVAEMDWDSAAAIRDGKRTEFTAAEARVLTQLVSHPGKILSREELQKAEGNDAPGARTIDNFLVKFRKTFEADPSSPEFFITYPRRGYQYNEKGRN